MTLTNAGRWVVFVTALFIVAAWPPDEGRSLLVKTVNWTVDPTGSLPFLPEQLDFGLSDDYQAVEMRDALVRRYDELFTRDAFTRTRLQLKVANDPFNHATERQLLLVFGVIILFFAARR